MHMSQTFIVNQTRAIYTMMLCIETEIHVIAL